MIKKVLVVDDDQEMLSSLKDGLEKYNESFSIILASDGQVALDKLKKNPISLVVTDLKMPKINGFVVLSHIMENYPDIPVIIITAYSTPEMEKRAHEGGAVGYIEKPFMIDDLAKKIMVALRKESEGGTLHGVSSGTFLQLIEVEQKSCTIRLTDKTSEQNGVLFFEDGELLDARTNTLQGRDAALKIFLWDNVTLSIQNDCPIKEKKIQGELQAILLDAMRIKDENKQKAKEAAAAKESDRPIQPETIEVPLIDQYISQNKKDEAVTLLFNMIVECAEKGDFIKAEMLRNKLFEVDSMALNEIIQAAEIIEIKKVQSIDSDHKSVWANLYKKVSSEEANTLYYSMKKCAYDTNEFVFKQGQPNSKLYFINQGRLKLTYLRDNHEILLKNLNPGDIAGHESFFFNSVCTTSLITLSPVKMTYIEQDVMLNWQKECPSLEAKLREYCTKNQNIQELLKQKAMDRRAQTRYDTGGKVIAQLLDVSGKLAGKAIKADLANISKGGLSFAFHIPKPETARLLLGRRMNLQFKLPSSEDEPEGTKTGMVVGVHSHPFDEYTIHVKFERV